MTCQSVVWVLRHVSGDPGKRADLRVMVAGDPSSGKALEPYSLRPSLTKRLVRKKTMLVRKRRRKAVR